MRILVGFAAFLLVLSLAIAHPSAQNTTTLEAPEQLAAWELFEERGDVLIPKDVVYDVSSALFSDYAMKLRTVRVPEGLNATFDGDAISFPIGTVISKTFYYSANVTSDHSERVSVHKTVETSSSVSLDRAHVRLLETRIMMNTESGWIALPYVWNADQSGATLQLAGESIAVRLIDGRKQVDFDYLVPDANQCASCHAADGVALKPIGLKARHLNKTRTIEGKRVNQLDHWRERGILAGNTPAQLRANAQWDDTNQTLDARARAYLDVNCSHCHGAQGAANHSGLWLTPEAQDPIQLGLCKPPVATGRGSGDNAYIIVPGKPRDSILLHRMQSTEPDVAMPELGRSLVHQEGVQLIEAWIRSLTKTSRRCTT